jgi:mersacidin/lichenicidin family type 2 lantibiotic
MKDLIIRAWKDPNYRASLSAEQRAALPESPAGAPLTDMSETELGQVAGAGRPVSLKGCTIVPETRAVLGRCAAPTLLTCPSLVL